MNVCCKRDQVITHSDKAPAVGQVVDDRRQTNSELAHWVPILGYVWSALGLYFGVGLLHLDEVECGHGGVVVGDAGSPGSVAPGGRGAQHGGRVGQGCGVVGHGGGVVGQWGGVVGQGGGQQAGGSHGDQGGEDNLKSSTRTNLARM
jgi:hypothetical protein